MSRSLLALSSIFLLAAGCRHAKVPELPASHGQLSLALHRYLELPSRVPNGAALDSPQVVVEPEQAPALFEEAVRVLKGKPTEEEVRQASDALTGACEAPFQPACGFLRQQFTAPENLDGVMPAYPLEALKAQAYALIVFRCRNATRAAAS